MSDLLPSLDERIRRLKALKLIAKRTAKALARIEAHPEMHLHTNAVTLMNDSLANTFAEIAQLERFILIEQARNTTPGARKEAPHA